MLRLPCALLLGSLLAPLASETALHADAVDDYLAREMALRKIPGLGLAVARDGEVVRISSYGLANVETGTPVAAESVFAIASLDKQVTAAALVKAAELGKLGLDDPVSQWVDIVLPGATLRQLVSHLSGLPDDTVPSFEGRYLTDYTSEQLLRQAQGLVPVAPPGRRFLYSDTGLLLAQIATEKAVDEPWWDFVRRSLFVPAGMTTPVSMTPALLLPHRVSAYTLDGSGELVRDRRLDTDFGPLYSDLGMTVADFARFLAAQDGERLLSRGGVAELTTPSRLADGSAAGEIFQWSRYGLGVGLDDLLGEPVTLHSGHSGVGFVRLPRRRLYDGRVHQPRASGRERPGRPRDRRRGTARAGARSGGARAPSTAARPRSRAPSALRLRVRSSPAGGPRALCAGARAAGLGGRSRSRRTPAPAGSVAGVRGPARRPLSTASGRSSAAPGTKAAPSTGG